MGSGRTNDVRGRRRASNPRWQASEGVHRPDTPSAWLAIYPSFSFTHLTLSISVTAGTRRKDRACCNAGHQFQDEIMASLNDAYCTCVFFQINPILHV